jgi:hypothetical protein
VSALALFAQASSDPAAVDAMNNAYAKACKMLHDRGQPALVQEIIAARIVVIAKSGERDPGRICAQVLSGLGLRADQ